MPSIVATLLDSTTVTIEDAQTTTDIKTGIAQQTGVLPMSMRLANSEDGAELTGNLLPAGLEVTVLLESPLLPGMEDTDEFRDMLYSVGVIRHEIGGFVLCLADRIRMDNMEDGDKYFVVYIVDQATSGTVWKNESPARDSTDQTTLKQDKYDMLLDLIRAYRELQECSHCNKKRRIMKNVDHCVGCVLNGLE